MARKRKAVDESTYSGRVAKRLVKLREAAGLSVEECVEKVNQAGYEMGCPAYRHWESSRTQINVDAIPAMAKALRVKPRELLPAR